MLLALESSCDESALALFEPEEGVIYGAIHSQIATHTVHGGVVPELAVREHLRRFPELLAALPIPLQEVSRIAVTVGPGLVGSLAIGMSLAHALALKLHVPIIGVNHLRGHAFSPFIELHKDNPEAFHSRFAALLPHLGLLVSGGNTILYEITAGAGSSAAPTLRLLGRTRDDAAGEALDKAAKMLGLGYPGGPQLEALARTAGPSTFDYDFPIAFRESPATQLEFSFSGLKTSLRYKLQKLSAAEVEAQKPALASAFQSAVVDSLIFMTRRALKLGGYKSLGLCGGVAQNTLLRTSFADLARSHSLEFLSVPPAYCGDNAGMIAFAAWVDPTGTVPAGSFLPSLRIDNSR